MRFFAGKEGGKKKSKSSYFNSSDYPTEASVRKALETTVVLTNSKTGHVKVDAPFSEIIVGKIETRRRAKRAKLGIGLSGTWVSVDMKRSAQYSIQWEDSSRPP